MLYLFVGLCVCVSVHTGAEGNLYSHSLHHVDSLELSGAIS